MVPRNVGICTFSIWRQGCCVCHLCKGLLHLFRRVGREWRLPEGGILWQHQWTSSNGETSKYEWHVFFWIDHHLATSCDHSISWQQSDSRIQVFCSGWKPSILLRTFSFSKCQAIAVHKLLKDSLHKNMTWNRRALSVESSVSFSHPVSMASMGPWGPWHAFRFNWFYYICVTLPICIYIHHLKKNIHHKSNLQMPVLWPCTQRQPYIYLVGCKSDKGTSGDDVKTGCPSGESLRKNTSFTSKLYKTNMDVPWISPASTNIHDHLLFWFTDSRLLMIDLHTLMLVKR